MILIRYLLQLLRKLSLVAFLGLLSFMIFHMVIATLGTALAWWHIDSTPYSVALTTFLYYVLPLIFLLFIYFLTCQLLHPSKENLEVRPLNQPAPSKKAFSIVRPVPSKKSSHNNRPVPNKKPSSNSRPVPNKKPSPNSRPVPNKNSSSNSRPVPNKKAKKEKGK